MINYYHGNQDSGFPQEGEFWLQHSSEVHWGREERWLQYSYFLTWGEWLCIYCLYSLNFMCYAYLLLYICIIFSQLIKAQRKRKEKKRWENLENSMNEVGRNKSLLGVCASRRQAVRQKGVGNNEAGSYGESWEYISCEKGSNLNLK